MREPQRVVLEYGAEVKVGGCCARTWSRLVDGTEAAGTLIWCDRCGNPVWLDPTDEVWRFQPDPEDPPSPKADEAYIWVMPGRQGGCPCINRTRITTDTIASLAIASLVWQGTLVDTVTEWYPITRRQVLVACWYEGRYGTRRWRKRFGEWADRDAHMMLWRSDGDLPSPPPTELDPA